MCLSDAERCAAKDTIEASGIELIRVFDVCLRLKTVNTDLPLFISS